MAKPKERKRQTDGQTERQKDRQKEIKKEKAKEKIRKETKKPGANIVLYSTHGVFGYHFPASGPFRASLCINITSHPHATFVETTSNDLRPSTGGCCLPFVADLM